MSTMPRSDVHARILDAIESRRDEIVALAADLIRQPSINPDLEPNPDAEAPAQRLIERWLIESGIADQVDVWAEPADERRPNVVAVRKGAGGPAARSLIFNGHVDVVPVNVEQAAAWSGQGPFAGEVRDGMLWGRGASDMKCGIAAYLMAAKVLHDTGIRLQGDLTLVQTIGEESGRKDQGCNAVLRRGYRADLAIFPEPTELRVFAKAKGEIYFRLTVEGKSTHIANRHLTVLPLPHGAERPGISALDNMVKYHQATMELERQWLLWRTHPNMESGGMFISLNTIHAGSMNPIPDTNVPDRCEATGSLLFYPGLKSEDVIAEVRAAYDRVTAGDEWLARHPPQLDIPFGHPMKEPLDLPFDHPGVTTALAAAELAVGRAEPVGVAPFVCDANYWHAEGQPSLVWGPGAIFRGVHGTDEHIPIDELIAATKAYAVMMLDWCGLAD